MLRPRSLLSRRTADKFFTASHDSRLLRSRPSSPFASSHHAYHHHPFQSFQSSPSSNGESVLWTLIGANTAVFLAWQIASPGPSLLPSLGSYKPRLRNFLTSNFLLSKQHLRAGHYWTLLTSAVSQMHLGHFVGNMFSLYAFGSVLTAFVVGPAHVATLAVGSALAGSIGFLWSQAGRSGPATVALGASGMVMGMGSAAACLAPRANMLLFGIVPCPLWVLVAGYAIYDSAMLGRPSVIGHAAHLGGLGFGVLYYFLRLRRFGGIGLRGIGNLRRFR